jgi:hypothetical protein
VFLKVLDHLVSFFRLKKTIYDTANIFAEGIRTKFVFESLLNIDIFLQRNPFERKFIMNSGIRIVHSLIPVKPLLLTFNK